MTMDRARLLRLALAVAVLAGGGLLLRGYVTDDTFIHLRYARHLVERGELSFNPGDPTYGCTSPLWVCGLALLLRLGLPALVAPWVLGGAAALLALLVFDALVTRLPLPAAWRLPLLLLFAADAWFLRWSWSGMETPLATALLLMLLWPVVARPASPRLWFGWGIAAGLAGLTRPEFLLLGPLAWPWLAWRGERPLWRRAGLPAALGAALVLAPWLVYAREAFGRFTPETAAAKSYALTLAPGIVGASLLRSAQQLGATQAPLWAGLLALAVLGRRAAGRPGPTAGDAGPGPAPRLVVPAIALTWLAVLCGGYAVKQVWVVSRYLSPLSPALLLAAALAAASLASGPGARPRTQRALLIGACVATFVLNGWLLGARVRPHARDLGRGLRECLLPLGEWLAANTPADAAVACLDIGALGWSSERRIVDLAGLVSPELLDIGRARGFPAMVASGAWLDVVTPDYLVDRTDGPPRWDGRVVHGVTFTRLRECVVPGLGVTEPQQWTVTLYRLDRVDPR
ncbi:MAG: hypothetical protein ACYDIE_06975 [Candidatus Krumholzibacteriia bacterium]